MRLAGDMSITSTVHHVDGLPAEILDLYPDGISRRRFLSLLSASAALAMGASCSKIDRGSIVPYTRHPGEIKPGVAAYYASTFQEGWNVQGVLVKTREGRPIHIEGNPEHPVSRGTVSLRAMGDLLGLYDPDRLRAPLFNGEAATWKDAEQALTRVFEEARSGDKKILLLTGAVVSPTQKALIGDLKSALPGLLHYCWEPAASDKAAVSFKDVFSQIFLERADVILSFQCDFLGNDTKAPLNIRDFAARRRISNSTDGMNRLWAIEGSMTLTGANADQRLQVRPTNMARLAFTLARLLNELHGIPFPLQLRLEDFNAFDPETTAGALGLELSTLKLLADDLARARKSALILVGTGVPREVHQACYLLNVMVEAEGNTVETYGTIPDDSVSMVPHGLNVTLEMATGDDFSAGIFWGVNPAYNCPKESRWKETILRLPQSFRIGLYEDETALDCNWRLPEHHWLESWGDFQSASDYISLRQPVIGPIHDTRQGEDLFLSCLRGLNNQAPQNYLEYLKARWRSHVYPAGSPVDFDDFWNGALHNGGAKSSTRQQFGKVLGVSIFDIEHALTEAGKKISTDTSEALELLLLPGSGVYDGRYANNGWLNELPDPVTKATWGNPVSLSPTDADRLGLQNRDVVDISSGDANVEAPVLIQPGQCPGVAALALGYGRRTGSIAAGIGTNAYPLTNYSSWVPEVNIRRKEGNETRPIPFTQTHDRMEGRDLARSWTRNQYALLSEKEEEHDPHNQASLIPEREYPGHKWSMTVDLSACVGCSACVIACQSENNIPVVGPERVLRGRHMHWIRIDRYYEGDLQNPSVVHQPMFCQHCDDAPCEIVCPVNATTHSPDGLNQMIYNRCVGTRYCSNNCPFKVRRFNFFDYTSMKTEPESLVFNPEVTVRPRGVMEKCTFCIQRVENAKQKAKVQGRAVEDGDIVPACAGACPAGALVFGDLNNRASRVARLSDSDRAYHMLEELGIKPSVTYLADISNPVVEEEEE